MKLNHTLKKKEARNKEEIKNDGQITCEAKNILNEFLGLPLIGNPQAIKKPQHTPEEEAWYEEMNKQFWAMK